MDLCHEVADVAVDCIGHPAAAAATDMGTGTSARRVAGRGSCACRLRAIVSHWLEAEVLPWDQCSSVCPDLSDELMIRVVADAESTDLAVVVAKSCGLAVVAVADDLHTSAVVVEVENVETQSLDYAPHATYAAIDHYSAADGLGLARNDQIGCIAFVR